MNFAESALLENIDNPNSLFIFPTDIAASRWADLVLRKKGGTIAMNKFIAWDVFKRNSIKSRVQNKQSIPSALRKIFVSRLVNENAQCVKQNETPLFSSIISVKWAQEASQFSSWLIVILPQLGSWFNKKTGLQTDKIISAEGKKASCNFEGDDKDMYVLASRYAHFLEEHGLFEPAWETPPFNDEGKDCFIFFPESLSDYSEYAELLSESNHVKTISAHVMEKNKCDAFFYTNSRSEITEASLYILALNQKKGVNWDSIAVCIPDSENYEPYTLREFSNRNIPFVKRTSKPLTDYPAGRFFQCILDCFNADFSFTSLISLIRNENLPWKDTETIESLINFGIENNCLYSWTEEIDKKEQKINVWEDAFLNPVDYFNNDIRKFFLNIKKRVSSLRSAESFAEVRRQYFIFREQFFDFDMDNCTEETDLILSRCISELMNLIELEKSFPDVPAIDPFLFFSEYLSEVPYLPQTKSSGVAILPYKTAAAAPFDCHIILGAGHEALSVIYSRLNFLPAKKREELGISDEDASSSFISMHKYNSIKTCAFFSSEQTFSGYAIPHPKTGNSQEPRQRYACEDSCTDKFSDDYFNLERDICSSKVINLHENQINGFNNWKNRKKANISAEKIKSINSFTAGDEINKIIHSRYVKNGRFRVSASALQIYYECSLKWLFQYFFSLKNTQIETSLMEENISGSVYHAVLSNFFGRIKDKPLAEPVKTDLGLCLPDLYIKILQDSINEIFKDFPVLSSVKNSKLSAITTRLLHAGKNDFFEHLKNCLSYFLSLFAGCIVTGTESYYKLEKENFLLNGYIDCLLKDTSDRTDKYIIVDFKRKWMPSRANCTAEDDNPLSDFQLPMYITLAEENENIKVYTALFYSILDQKPEVIIGSVKNIDSGFTIPAKDENIIKRESEWHKKIFMEFDDKVKQFTEELSAGTYSVFPQNSGDCLNCTYHRICRTVYVVQRETGFSLEYGK